MQERRVPRALQSRARGQWAARKMKPGRPAAAAHPRRPPRMGRVRPAPKDPSMNERSRLQVRLTPGADASLPVPVW